MPRVIHSHRPPAPTGRQRRFISPEALAQQKGYRTVMSLGVGHILIPCAKLGAWTTALMSRVIALPGILAPAVLGHSLIQHFETHEGHPYGLHQAGFVDCDLRHATMAVCLFTGHYLSPLACKKLQEISTSLHNYSRLYIFNKLKNLPDALERVVAKIQKPAKSFTHNQLRIKFTQRVQATLEESYRSLDRLIKENDETLSYSFVNQKMEECSTIIADHLKHEKAAPIIDLIGSQFLDDCKPPIGECFRPFFTSIPEKIRNEHTKLAQKHNIPVQEIAFHYTLAIFQYMTNNRDLIIEEILKKAKPTLTQSNKNLHEKYKSHMTTAIQKKAANKAREDTAEMQLPSSSFAATGTKECSKDKLKILEAFNNATERLNNVNVTHDEFKKLRKSIDTVLNSPDLLETAQKCYGRQQVRLAEHLSREYTMFYQPQQP